VRKLLLLFVLLTATLAFSGVAAGAPGDVDNDTIADASDNCPTVYNIDQFDRDGDLIGDTCDPSPGFAATESVTIVYLRDATTGGPLSADPTSSRCVSGTVIGYDGGVQSGVNTSNCYRRFVFSSTFSSTQTVVFTVTQQPPGCQAQFSSPITMTYHGGGTLTVINAYFLCDAALSFANLRTASTGVGPGASLADKAALAQRQYTSGNTAGACETLTGYVNQVNALSGKKITTTTAAALVAQAEALRTETGC
jgi:hypothetical protein